MTERPGVGSREEIAVIDLSGPPHRPPAIRTGPLHDEVLSFLRRHGEASRDELVERFSGVPYRGLLRVLEDLSALGKIRITWTSPFRFSVRAIGTLKDLKGSPPRVLV